MLFLLFLLLIKIAVAVSYKRTYHSNVAIAYQLNILPGHLLKSIPYSTRYYWRQKDLSLLFGYEWSTKVHEDVEALKKIYIRKRFFRVVKALLAVILTYQEIIEQVRNRRMVLLLSKKVIVDAVYKAKDVLGLKRALSLFAVSRQQFYRWKHSVPCRRSALNLCLTQYPGQLRPFEIKAVVRYCRDRRFLHWPLSSVYWKMLRDKTAFMSLSTFYKYVRLMGLKKLRPKVKKKRSKIGIRATKPFDVLHMDVTVFKTLDGLKAYIYIIQDNFSRSILGWRVALSCNAQIACDNLREVCLQHGLFNRSLQLITDDGSENNGAVNDFLLQQDVCIKKLVAQKDILFSNSMVEAVNKKIKYEFLKRVQLEDFNALEQFLSKVVPEYNNRPHGVLYGCSPAKVLAGRLPDSVRFRKEIMAAKARRYRENGSGNCEGC